MKRRRFLRLIAVRAVRVRLDRRERYDLLRYQDHLKTMRALQYNFPICQAWHDFQTHTFQSPLRCPPIGAKIYDSGTNENLISWL